MFIGFCSAAGSLPVDGRARLRRLTAMTAQIINTTATMAAKISPAMYGRDVELLLAEGPTALVGTSANCIVATFAASTLVNVLERVRIMRKNVFPFAKNTALSGAEPGASVDPFEYTEGSAYPTAPGIPGTSNIETPGVGWPYPATTLAA